MYRVEWIEIWQDYTETHFTKCYGNKNNAYALAWQLLKRIKTSRNVTFWDDGRDHTPHRHFRVAKHEFRRTIKESIQITQIIKE